MAKFLVIHVHVHILIVNILIIIFFLIHTDLLNRTDHQCNKVEVGFCPPLSILGWGFVRSGHDPYKKWGFVRRSFVRHSITPNDS